MKIIYKTLIETINFMKYINKNYPELNCYFKGTQGEVHLIIEENKFTIIK